MPHQSYLHHTPGTDTKVHLRHPHESEARASPEGHLALRDTDVGGSESSPQPSLTE